MTKGLARKGFDLDLQDGLEAEDRLTEALFSAKIEVKSDKMAWKTKNIFVELECNKKLSGFSTTEADFWAFEVRNKTFLIVPIEKLYKMVKKALNVRGKIVGGDYNKSVGVLIPLEWFIFE